MTKQKGALWGKCAPVHAVVVYADDSLALGDGGCTEESVVMGFGPQHCVVQQPLAVVDVHDVICFIRATLEGHRALLGAALYILPLATLSL